jgi:hypothetical protein
MDVPYVRQVGQVNRLVGEQRRCHHRQRRVLVTRRPHMTLEAMTAFDYESAHRSPS